MRIVLLLIALVAACANPPPPDVRLVQDHIRTGCQTFTAPAATWCLVVKGGSEPEVSVTYGLLTVAVEPTTSPEDAASLCRYLMTSTTPLPYDRVSVMVGSREVHGC